ncbi:MAG TPA: hypothetical protein VFO25_05195 [Candidatus Eremiobacteraceae bacterium]|nr:hypothetical protein [Candidatus Eremiobacteraceae bacterium]
MRLVAVIAVGLAGCSALPHHSGIYAIIDLAPHAQVKALVPAEAGHVLVVADDLQTHNDTLIDVASDGSVKALPVSGNWHDITGISRGTDGTVWLSAGDPRTRRYEVARYASGRVEFERRTAGSAASIAGAPDGSAWVAETSNDEIRHITSAGELTEFKLARIALVPHAGPWSIAIDKLGDAWFTLTWADAIGRMTPAGRLSIFKVKTPNSRPQGIGIGPDGDVWFTELTANRIGRISPAGAVTEFASPSIRDNPHAIVAGMNDDLWFCEIGTIGRITTSGEITTRLAPFGACGGIGVDRSGQVWFTQDIPSALFRGPTRTAVATFTETDWSER